MKKGIVFALCAVLFVPHAVGAASCINQGEINAQCASAPDGTPVTCIAGTNPVFTVKGVCVGKQFKALTASGIGGGSSAIDIGKQLLGTIVGQLIGKLMSGGGAGGGGSAVPTGQVGVNSPINTGVSGTILGDLDVSGDTSTTPSNPINDILGSVFGTQTVDTPVDEENATSTNTVITQTSGGTNASASTSGAQSGTGSAVGGTGGNSTGGTSGGSAGNITGAGNATGSTGGTSGDGLNNPGVQTVDNVHNPQIVGFGNTGGTAQQSGALTSLCTNRPWASGIVARFISPSFFDGLCNRWGYTPGSAAANQNLPVDISREERSLVERTAGITRPTVGISCTPEVMRKGGSATLEFSCGTAQLSGVAGFAVVAPTDTRATVRPEASTQYGIRCGIDTVYSCTVRVVDPQLKVWAEPAAVNLGARTQIYWSTQDVVPQSCTLTGPSFSERGPQGGAATVPINDRSRYTLSCTGLDGLPIQETLVVDLAI